MSESLISQLERAMAFDGDALEKKLLKKNYRLSSDEIYAAKAEHSRRANLDKALLNCVKALVDVRPNLERIQREINQCRVTYNMTMSPTVGDGHLRKAGDALSALAAELAKESK